MQSRDKRCVISLPRDALVPRRDSHHSHRIDFLLGQAQLRGVSPGLLLTTPATSTFAGFTSLARRLRAHVVVARGRDG